MSLPTADDLFRPTGEPEDARGDREPVEEPAGRTTPVRAVPDAETGRSTATRSGREPARRRTSSGRVRHDEKMTVYVTADELLDLEHARLELRRHHGVAVDRGRLVREAIAIALADLEGSGVDSLLVKRLTGD